MDSGLRSSTLSFIIIVSICAYIYQTCGPLYTPSLFYTYLDILFRMVVYFPYCRSCDHKDPFIVSMIPTLFLQTPDPNNPSPCLVVKAGGVSLKTHSYLCYIILQKPVLYGLE